MFQLIFNHQSPNYLVFTAVLIVSVLSTLVATNDSEYECSVFLAAPTPLTSPSPSSLADLPVATAALPTAGVFKCNTRLAFFSISRTCSSSSSSFFFHAMISSACLRLRRSFFSRSVKYFSEFRCCFTCFMILDSMRLWLTADSSSWFV